MEESQVKHESLPSFFTTSKFRRCFVTKDATTGNDVSNDLSNYLFNDLSNDLSYYLSLYVSVGKDVSIRGNARVTPIWFTSSGI
jgi:hypothetical protein